jgi:dimethylglycine dehydrogenase
MKHQYLVTEPIKEFIDRDEEIPVIRDPYPNAYYRQEQHSGLIGIYERTNTREAWFGSGHAWESESELFPAEYEPIMPGLERVMERMPIFADAGIMRVINGANPRTPDHNPLLGPAPGLRNFWLACGQNIGIAQGAVAGKYLAQWMMYGAADINTTGVDPRRFGPYADKDYARAKAHQDFTYMYVVKLPGEERPAGRPARTSPLHEKLKSKGAVFSETFGWERPKWFSLDGRKEELGFRRNNIFEVVGDECKAVRERVAVLDLSSFTKHDVTGPDAEKFLNRVLANRVSRRKGGIVLAHGLTAEGRIESEYSVTRFNDEHFYLLSAAAANVRNSDQLNRNKQDGERVTITNITDDWGVLILAGPRSRELLNKISDVSLNNEQFPWLTGKEFEIAGVMMRALRINYVGELGWELHVPIDQLEKVYGQLWSAGEEFAIADFGMHALSSLGKEKAYYSWGVELINEITMIEVGMERFVDFDKGDFVGREALIRRQKEQLAWSIAYVEVESEDADLRGSEPAFDGDMVIGVTTSGAYGHAVQKSLGFVYVKPEYALPGTRFDIQILGRRCPAKVLAEAAYDPQNKRLQA